MKLSTFIAVLSFIPLVTPNSLTTIDILSSSPSHSTFLHLLQRAKLVPTLNFARNSTVIAPTNEAWEKWFEEKGLKVGGFVSRGEKGPISHGDQDENSESRFEYSDFDQSDNINYAIRQHLLYHILNHTITFPSPSEFRPAPSNNDISQQPLSYPFLIKTEATLLFPHKSIAPPTNQPPVGSPWLPTIGDGDLGGEGQRLRFSFVFDGNEKAANAREAAPPFTTATVTLAGIGGDWQGHEAFSIWDEWPERNVTLPGTGGGDGNEPEPTLSNSKKIAQPTNYARLAASTTKEKSKGKGKDRAPQQPEGVTRSQTQQAKNGIVIGLNSVLPLPQSISTIISTHPDLSYLQSLISSSFGIRSIGPLSSLSGYKTPDFESESHLTVFAPTNKAFFSGFDHLERAYLKGEFGGEGVRRILGELVVRDAGNPGIENGTVENGNGRVGWRSVWDQNGNGGKGIVQTTSGTKLNISVCSNGSMTLASESIIYPDLFASNGVLHLVPSLVLPPTFKLLNSAEKMLLTLNATRFVSLMRATGLSESYTGEGAGGSWTLLAPTDDVLERMDRWGSLKLREAFIASDSGNKAKGQLLGFGSMSADSKLKEVLQYHVLKGAMHPADLKDNQLLETELKPKSLGGARQRLLVQLGRARPGEDDRETTGNGDIRFGTATVLASPVQVGGSIIYLISDLLEPPLDLIQTAVSELTLSTFVASIFASRLDKWVRTSAGITYLAPTNKAFSQLGLTLNWLLHAEQSAKDDLRRVIRYHAVEGLVYETEIAEGNTTIKTVGGEELLLNKGPCSREACRITANRSITLSGPTRVDNVSGLPIPINGDYAHAHITQQDILTETGVLHVIDRVQIPPNVHITVGKLMAGAKAGVMADLMVRAGLSWILEGGVANATLGDLARPPEDGRKSTWHLAPTYTVLVPRDEAFAGVNLTRLMEDPVTLLTLLKQHIITSHSASTPRDIQVPLPLAASSRPISLVNDMIYSTMHSGDSAYGDLVITEEPKGRGWLIGIAKAYGGEAKNAYAKLLESGKATPVWRTSEKDGGSSTSGSLPIPDGAALAEDHSSIPASGGFMALGGGIIVIDSVLVPFEPSFLAEWGWWIGGSIFAGLVVIACLVILGWWLWKRREGQIRLDKVDGERLEGEETD